jgi:hypothetical protein
LNRAWVTGGQSACFAASALEHEAALLTSAARVSQVDGLRCGHGLDDFLP